MPQIELIRVNKGAGGQSIWEASVQWALGLRVTRWGDRASVALMKLAAECAGLEREEEARIKVGEVE